MKNNTKSVNTAYILNNINQEVIKIELSKTDIQALLRFRKTLCNDISRTKTFEDSNLIKIKVVYDKNSFIQLFDGQMFVYDNNIFEYYLDPNMITQNYIINKAYKHNYDKLKQVVYLDSVNK